MSTTPKIVYCSLMNQNAMFNSALQSLPQFIMETDADWGMVYDYMECQCGDLKDYHWEEVAEAVSYTHLTLPTTSRV